MVSLELRSVRNPEHIVIRAAQPVSWRLLLLITDVQSLPPPPLPAGLVSLPPYPASLLPPCIIPWPFRFLCPSRIFGYVSVPNAKIKERRRKGSLMPPARGNEVVLMTKELLEGVVVRPGRGDGGIGAVFVSIGESLSTPGEDGATLLQLRSLKDKLTSGREDTHDNIAYHREVRTTGWVVVRFVPHPTGVRWLLTSNPLPPLLILPPLSLVLTISSALLGFLVISCCSRGRQKRHARIAEKEERRKEKKEQRAERAELRGEVEGRLDFDGDRVEPFRGGTQWSKFAREVRPSPRNRTTSRGNVNVEVST